MTHLRKMDAVDPRNRLDAMKQGLIGRPLNRVEGPLKVTGKATYAAEWQLPGAAFGVFVRATVASGTVTQLDADSVSKMPGVLGVFSEPRMLAHPAQGGDGKAPTQGTRRVLYYGQPVALVVAESFEQATAAANALVLEYSDTAQGAVFDPEAAGSEVEDDPKAVDQGDLDAAMNRAAFTVDQVYRTPGHASAAMEPHSATATWEGDQLTLRGSYQMLKFNLAELADALGIPPGKVRILSPYVGGGFGSKLGISHEAVGAALAAKALARPVRVDLSRQQVFEQIMRRSETRQRVRLAADRDGKLIGIGHECLVSQLPGEEFSEPVTQATSFLYGGEHRRSSVAVARVSRLCAGSVRAPGEAVGMQALESAMDELAQAAGIDPVELRKRNLPERDPEKGVPYSSRKLAEALDEGARRFGWSQRQSRPCQRREGEWWIGMGMASAARVNLLQEAHARVSLHKDGTVSVACDMTDIGTGSYTIFAQIAGEMLGVPIERVSVQLGDTALPAGSGSGGSWGAASSGSAVFQACEAIRSQLAERLHGPESALELKDGVATLGATRTSVVQLLQGEAIEAEGAIQPGEAKNKATQATYGAFFAEVAVHAWTGEIRVRRMTGVFGIGRVLNEKTARSQCYGGMVWGIGSALTEALCFDARDGHLINHDLAEYHVPVNMDVPQLEVAFIEERDPWANPIQAKGVGELGICGAAGAISNAVYNACGVRVRDYPLTVDKLLAELPMP